MQSIGSSRRSDPAHEIAAALDEAIARNGLHAIEIYVAKANGDPRFMSRHPNRTDVRVASRRNLLALLREQFAAGHGGRAAPDRRLVCILPRFVDGRSRVAVVTGFAVAADGRDLRPERSAADARPHPTEAFERVVVNEALSVRNGVAHLEDASLLQIAQRCGTPTYVYSRAHFASQYARLDAALQPLPHRICYAVKANGNLAILNLFASLGAGFDIVSGGELERVVRAGGDPAKVIFSGVGKSGAEIDFALKLGIGSFNVESAAELDRLELHAQRLSRKARISVRVNPDIDAGTHPYISTGLKSNKFGVPRDEALAMYRRASNSQWLEVLGVDCHIGSQIAKPAPLVEALQSLLELVDTLAA